MANALDSDLLEAEDRIDTEGLSDRQIEIAAQDLRKKYDTKSYELDFIKALAKDVADLFKSGNGSIPEIPAAKMVKNAIAWIVAYKLDSGFDIKQYKPPTKSNQGGYVYRELSKSKQETIPWPADEPEEEKAGWPISKTPNNQLQKAFETELAKLTQGSNTSTASGRAAPKIEPSSAQTPSRAISRTPAGKTATPNSAAPKKQSKTSSTSRQLARQEAANPLVRAESEDVNAAEIIKTAPELLRMSKIMQVAETKPTEPVEIKHVQMQTVPAPPPSLSLSKILKTAETEPSEPIETKHVSMQTEPAPPPPLSLSKILKTAETEPSEPIETKHVSMQTEPAPPPPLSLSKIMQVAETEPSKPVETIGVGTQVNMGPRKLNLSPAITPALPHITQPKEDEDLEKMFDYNIEDVFNMESAFSAGELRTLTKSRPGTQKLYTWFSSEYQGSDPDHKAIAFSRFMRDLRDPKGPVNDDNLFSYFKDEGPASPEPSSQADDYNNRKRKASDSSLRNT